MELPPLSVGRDVGRDHARSSQLEWLETNGTGAFAMGTVAGTNTRRYHGLLVASLRPPVDRHVLLSRLDEVVSDPQVFLASNQYPGAVSPKGHEHLLEFRLDPFPTWVYDVGGAQVEKQLFLVPGEQTVVVQYRSTGRRHIAISPFLAFREYHSLQHANGSLDPAVRLEGDLTLRLRPYPGLPGLAIHASAGARFEGDGVWCSNTEYLAELDRGLDFREDLWKAGTLHFDLGPERPLFIAATTGAGRFDDVSAARLASLARESRRPRNADAFLARLENAADQFIVQRADGRPTVMAGYPWFTDWGRDTMISLPGLMIARGRLREAREVLRGFLSHLDQGVIPNVFPDRSGVRPEYNTVDATLWMFQAVAEYLRAGGEARFLTEEFYPAAAEIVRWHRIGTHHGIRVDPLDRLLTQGAPGVQLTWMDARVGDRVITPRHGKAVEINALWYNALRLMSVWGGEREYAAEADAVRASFQRAFWNAERGCLYDVLGDASVRPNQLFAVSLPFPLLAPEQRRSVVRVVAEELLTPYGLRTLAPQEPAYVGTYGGNVEQRDGAYHQGTVWPWLLGPFVRAYLNAHGRTAETVRHCRELLDPLREHLERGALLGSISEVFDGDAPHRPGGAPAQAWSVAELLQLLAVDLADHPTEREWLAQPPDARR